MLNLLLGEAGSDEGRPFIETVAGRKGHAIYGPYEMVEPGRYAVSFALEMIGSPRRSSDPLTAVLDVVANAGHIVLARKPINLSQLAAGSQRFRVEFEVEQALRLEYRVWVSGACALRISDHRRLMRLDAPNDGRIVTVDGAFPEPTADTPAFFREHAGQFRELYDSGAEIGFDDAGTIVTIDGLSFYARRPDDLNFVNEVFFERVYHFVPASDFCVIDVGLNIGFSSLTFAAQGHVREVHGFEPFAATYDRATDNIALNPAIAGKITCYDFGLSDADWSGDLHVGGSDDSGAQSVVGGGAGTPVFIHLKDAAATLRPILTQARAKGLRTMMKVDCEGSEFRVFEALARDGLFDLIDAVMVEWHAMFHDKSQRDLFAPLHEAGFLVFDRSPRIGNGFFYAVRIGRS